MTGTWTRREMKRLDHAHRCPAPRCQARVAVAVFACRRHWLALSPALRATIRESWETGDYLAHSSARAEAIAWWSR